MLSEHFLIRTISCLTRDQEFASRFLPVIPDELFDSLPVVSRVWASLKAYNTAYARIPDDVANFAEAVISHPPEGWTVPNQEEANEVLDLIQTIAEDNLADKEWLEDNLANEVQRIMYKATWEQFAPLLSGEDFGSELRSDIKKQFAAADAVTFLADLGTPLMTTIDERVIRRQLEITQPLTRVATMLGNFDLKLKGQGVPLKSLALIAARPGVGKSIALIHLAKAAVMTGYKVLFVTLELSMESVQDRFDATLTATKPAELEARGEVILERFKGWLGRRQNEADIRLVEEIAGSFSVSKLDWLLDQLERTENFKPQVICIDYADLMRSDRKYDKLTDEIKNLYVGLRGLAMARNILIWTASQVNRAGENAEFAGLEHLADSDAKGQTVDLALSLRQTPEEKTKNQVFVWVAKNRFGESDWGFMLDQNLPTLSFTADGPTV
jgi:Herelleviridae helicase DnaB-like